MVWNIHSLAPAVATYLSTPATRRFSMVNAAARGMFPPDQRCITVLASEVRDGHVMAYPSDMESLKVLVDARLSSSKMYELSRNIVTCLRISRLTFIFSKYRVCEKVAFISGIRDTFNDFADLNLNQIVLLLVCPFHASPALVMGTGHTILHWFDVTMLIRYRDAIMTRRSIRAWAAHQ
jgi:hypothetical protein